VSKEAKKKTKCAKRDQNSNDAAGVSIRVSTEVTSSLSPPFQRGQRLRWAAFLGACRIVPGPGTACPGPLEGKGGGNLKTVYSKTTGKNPGEPCEVCERNQTNNIPVISFSQPPVVGSLFYLDSYNL